MSLNIVDALVKFSNKTTPVGLIPSRRQVDFNGGYVNDWTTAEFAAYVKEKNNTISLQRDHGGAAQGYVWDNGYESFAHDSEHFHLIHIDPWKEMPTYTDGLAKTIKYMKFIYHKNPNIRFEIGTEEAIRKFEVDELEEFVTDIKALLPAPVYAQLEYVVVQSGVGLDLGKMTNTGTYCADRLAKMVNICKNNNLKSKEHNGDYLSIDEIKSRFSVGLDAINIAPEFGQIETLCYLEEINDEKTFQTIFDICYNSDRWKKWVDDSFNPKANQKELIKICCHYIFSNPWFQAVKPNIDEKIKKTITRRMEELHGI